ncbi:MAG: hypothetical protein ACRDLN_11190 [Solirubrobacteraceae bacterium]
MGKSRAKKKRRQRARAGADERQARIEQRAAARADAPAPAATEPRPSRLDVRVGIPRPDAVWAPFPLTEIGMAVGLALFAAGFAGGAAALLLAGVGVLAVVVAELCLREHFAGFRSHSILLGLLPVTAVHLGVVYFADATWRGLLALAIDLALAGALAWWLQRRFVLAQGRARIAGR